LSGVHGSDNSRHHHLDIAPPVSTENHDRDFAGFQVLLIGKVLIGGEQNIEPSLLGGPKQFAIRQYIPALLPRGFHYVAR
jgi:hypothetical protein